LIERLGVSGLVDSKVLKNRLLVEKNTSAQRALLLALGGFAPEQHADLVSALIDMYRNDPDPGIHGAASWLLRTWKQADALARIDAELATDRPERRRDWYVDKHRQTFSVIHPLREPGGGDKKPMPTYPFAIGVTEVRVSQFREFRSNHQVDERVVKSIDSPVNNVSWYDAAAYCNWLSEKAGMHADRWAYQPGKDKRLELVPDYRERDGYRLPTEAEWEFACRAGAESPWSFGNSDEELGGRYCWWTGNTKVNGAHQCFPVASLKPNDFGLFDMHGSLMELCQESTNLHKGRFDDIETAAAGGCIHSLLDGVVCNQRMAIGRDFRLATLGFRLVRSLR
jgi:hypothetical protein